MTEQGKKEMNKEIINSMTEEEYDSLSDYKKISHDDYIKRMEEEREKLLILLENWR